MASSDATSVAKAIEVKKDIADKPAGTTRPSPVQEYKSSIRTMSDDITSIKSGQKPSGVDVPRRVTPDMPKAPEVSRPQAPAPSGPMPSVGLGRTETSGSLPGLPKPAGSTSRPGPITDLGQVGKTGPLPIPAAPKKATEPFKVPGIQPSVIIPSEKKGISAVFYLLIAGVLVVGGFLYWFLALRAPAPEVVLSPTPTPTQIVTPTPVVRNLSDIFEGVPVSFEIASSETIVSDFRMFVKTLAVAGGGFLKIDLFKNLDGTLIPLNWMDMFEQNKTGTDYPFGLSSVADPTTAVTVIYGQLETFNKDGSVNFNGQGLNRTAFMARVTDSVEVETIMRDWELAMMDHIADYLLIDDTSKEESVNFLDNTYRGVAIRYKNFPFPDITVDYAIVPAADQNYLVITGSREAMYAVIDVLLAP